MPADTAQPADKVPAATRGLAEFAAGLRWDDVPAPVIAHAKLCILDALGCCLFGTTLPWTRILVETIRDQGGHEQASIWGTPYRTSLAHAALANCAAGHSFELDDLHTAGLLHATTLSVPVAIACAERHPCTGRDFLLACIAGFEAGLRVGMAGTHGLFHRGFHPQGASGVFCAAATAARMMGLDAGQTQHALGIAASQAAGLMAAQEGAMSKRFHGGHAGQAGVMAALLAQRGFTGIADAIEAPYGGFLAAYSDKPDRSLLLAGLGSVWETLAIGFKAYPTVSCIHGPLAMLRTIMQEHRLAAGDITGISVKCSTFTYRHTVWPYRATGLTEAQMNMSYGLAVMAIDGATFVEQFRPERLADPAIMAFTQRINAEIDPAIDALGPARRDTAVLSVHTHDGRSFTQERAWRPGSPEDPLSADALRAKFRRLLGTHWPEARAERIIALVDELDRTPSLAPLAEALRE
ncbi:MAG: MmgE/PrpD family protein [Alphaproteobacteria bacterium]|nr:MmgE/PrpD family protein [Alphaproteobacteria bacterium]